MKLEGSHQVAAPRAAVWRVLMDPAALQRSIPGCQKLEATGANAYRATIKAGVGAIKGTFTGDLAIADVVPEESYTLTSRTKAPMGFVEGKGKVELEDAGEETVVRYSGEVKIGGMLASVGERLIDAAARKNISELFSNLARECGQLQE
jgi:carbon monoxide dehydrogenase subunit G